MLCSWNCQDIENDLTVHRLKEICLCISPNIMFLMETKNSDDFVFHALEGLGFINRFSVPPEGLSGGLVLL